MKIGVVGLGKMGLNIALNLLDHKENVVGFDVFEGARQAASEQQVPVVQSLEDLVNNLDEQKVVLLSVPSGDITNDLVATLVESLNEGDIIVDAGNSNYKHSLNNYALAKAKGIGFLDCGTSGGMEGAREGACLMIGGDEEVFKQVEFIFENLAIENGYLYTGKAGSGHYLKMIHNGIEYGMMQAMGEGFDILHASQYDFDYEKVAKVWNNGSVIRSWLMELVEKSFAQDPQLDDIRGVVDASGEGKWTVLEALELNIPVPVITESLYARSASKIDDSFSAKVVATMRNQFGGHAVVGKGE
ncbi:phosphogluconate dehydrogenase (NAD(+)-dependent, decarboxylating) [Fundicoccus sp. Sow4_F4]|uniref:phosphogluconate dehydrogenase (NAD(+)-dependent, decarboxylating) n=1 Tax=Fundicoccus sp. Sow4_F4 TaxID=3438783 RepID=UPI003F900D03